MRVLVIILVCWCGLAQAQPVKLWDKNLGGRHDDHCSAISPAPDGGWLLAGTSRSGVSGDKSDSCRKYLYSLDSPYDYWAVRIDANGHKLWDKTYGGYKYDNCTAIAPASDGGWLLAGSSDSYVSGEKSEPRRDELEFGDDYWVVRIDSNGNKLWDKTFGGNGADLCSAVAPASDGGWILAGYSESGVSGEKSEPRRDQLKYSGDYWVVRIDSNGNKLWDKTFGGDSRDRCSAIAPTSNGDWLLAGYSSSNVSGEKSDTSDYTDYWVVRIDANGNKLWDKTLGGNGGDYCTAFAPASDGGWLVGGYSQSNVSGEKSEPRRDTLLTDSSFDYWVIRIDTNGHKLWDKTVGARGLDKCWAIAQASDGRWLLGGEAYGPVYGDKSEPGRGGLDYWVVCIDANGRKLWDKTLGGDGGDVCTAIAPTLDNNWLVAGSSYCGVHSDRSDTCRGGDDYWIIRLSGETAVHPLQLRNLLTRAATPGQADGHIRITAYGGSGVYEYSINGGLTWLPSRIFKFLSAGTYEVIVRDANNISVSVRASATVR